MNEEKFEREASSLKHGLGDEEVYEIAEALAAVGGLVPIARK